MFTATISLDVSEEMLMDESVLDSVLDEFVLMLDEFVLVLVLVVSGSGTVRDAAVTMLWNHCSCCSFCF
jgi:hypothetical protein